MSNAEAARRIADATGLRAMTAQQFGWETIGYYIRNTGIPINFGITVVLGFLVGTAIAGQTFYMFTLENLKQFGALKAMGATNWRIVGHDPAPGAGGRRARLRHRRRRCRGVLRSRRRTAATCAASTCCLAAHAAARASRCC